ncbi:hypothetical protein EVAR_58853_1 [Eumeta japonica]|uniref:Uncharacterized protein n=1 Tax=Eumeta variegata TaxID=151549 RepID=A0A4C1Y765_EUMVA|nr:hypothetical protein EVAR_58853_1 [Eumeta japonica]
MCTFVREYSFLNCTCNDIPLAEILPLLVAKAVSNPRIVVCVDPSPRTEVKRMRERSPLRSEKPLFNPSTRASRGNENANDLYGPVGREEGRNEKYKRISAVVVSDAPPAAGRRRHTRQEGKIPAH